MIDNELYIEALNETIDELKCSDCHGECELSKMGMCRTKRLESLVRKLESEG